eukprot:jgi/Mesvir1/11781/Mv00148-RA.1
MEAPASSSVLADESIDDKLAANKIASENAAAKKAANKRTKTSAATSEATPIAVETSLPDSISSSFYMPGARLSLDDIAAFLGFSDAEASPRDRPYRAAAGPRTVFYDRAGRH